MNLKKLTLCGALLLTTTASVHAEQQRGHSTSENLRNLSASVPIYRGDQGTGNGLPQRITNVSDITDQSEGTDGSTAGYVLDQADIVCERMTVIKENILNLHKAVSELCQQLEISEETNTQKVSNGLKSSAFTCPSYDLTTVTTVNSSEEITDTCADLDTILDGQS